MDRPNVHCGGCGAAFALNLSREYADTCEVQEPLRDRAAPALRDEGGFGLIEVIVSALLLTLVSLGVYMGIDGASATSGINKHRSVATQLAQQDQDRMRAMTVNELSNYRDSGTQTIGGVVYTTTSVASWITDSTGAANCTSGTTQASYLRIATTVTWPNMPIDPVEVESMIAPPNGSFGSDQGSMAVQVNDRNGVGVSGVTVTLAGPQGYTDVTNEAGCVLWGYLPATPGASDSYTVSIAKAGYVDGDNVAAPVQTVDVIGESTATVSFDYDVGGFIQANFQTYSGGTYVPMTSPVPFSAKHPADTVAIGPWGAPYKSPALFPSTAAYSVYAGSCLGAEPPTAQGATVTPNGTTNVTLQMPPVNIRVMRTSSQGLSGATVKLTAVGSGCSGTTTYTANSTGNVAAALPYGKYAVCVSGTAGSPSVVRRMTTPVASPVVSSLPTGTALQTFALYNSSTTGACP